MIFMKGEGWGAKAEGSGKGERSGKGRNVRKSVGYRGAGFAGHGVRFDCDRQVYSYVVCNAEETAMDSP